VTVTIKEIAKRAKLSHRTISAVVGRCGKETTVRVGEKTRQRVLALAQEMGYRPNLAARALRGQSTATLGLITLSLEVEVQARRFTALERIAHENDYLAVCAINPNLPHVEDQLIDWLTQRCMDALVVIPTYEGEHARLRALVQQGFPVVTINGQNRLPFPTWDVSTDHVAGGQAQIDHLLQIGRRRLLLLGPADEAPSVIQRSAGARHSAAQAGVPLTHLRISVPDWPKRLGNMHMVYDQVLQALRPHADRIDGLAASNDHLAMLAIRALASLGRRVPQDVAVVGYDDVMAAELSMIPLTTVHQPAEEDGRTAFDFLTRQLQSREVGQTLKPQQSLVKPRLVRRASTLGFDGSEGSQG
jgi:LacI family transcriptional regulator